MDVPPKPRDVHVSFAPTVKKHDGLCMVSKLLDMLMFRYFHTQTIHTKKQIHGFLLDNMEEEDVQETLHALSGRISVLWFKTTTLQFGQTIAVLSQGGGCGMAVSPSHTGHLKRIHRFVHELID
jgi:hypothetical protein